MPQMDAPKEVDDTNTQGDYPFRRGAIQGELNTFTSSTVASPKDLSGSPNPPYVVRNPHCDLTEVH